MKLYVCWGTFGTDKQHACARALSALQRAGHEPEVVRTYGCYGTDRLFAGRHHVREISGNFKVPVLELETGAVIDGSAAIVEWAAAHGGSGERSGSAPGRATEP